MSDAEKARRERLAAEITAKQAEIDKGRARFTTIEDEVRRVVQELSPAT